MKLFYKTDWIKLFNGIKKDEIIKFIYVSLNKSWKYDDDFSNEYQIIGYQIIFTDMNYPII